MSREQNSNKEAKKKALMTPKEKKAAKKLKKETKGIINTNMQSQKYGGHTLFYSLMKIMTVTSNSDLSI